MVDIVQSTNDLANAIGADIGALQRDIAALQALNIDLTGNSTVQALQQNQAVTLSQLATLEALVRSLQASPAAPSGGIFAEVITQPIYRVEKPQDNARRFYRLVRDFVTTIKPWDVAIHYQTLPDERYSMPLISYRVYGEFHYYMAIMASANLDSVENPLMEQLLILPTRTQLEAMLREAGFEPNHNYRV